MELKQSITINGQEVNLEMEAHGLKFFTTEEADILYIVKNSGKVIFQVSADCGQNCGYISEIIKIH